MTSSSGDQPSVAPGDVWLLTWDGVTLGEGMVARVAATHVLMWPITNPGEAWFSPAITLPPSEGKPRAAWPTRETGVGLHLLDTKLASVMSARTVGLIEDAVESGAEPPLPFVTAPPPHDAEHLSDQLIDKWESICFHIWPRATELRIRRDQLSRHHMSPGALADVLELSVSDAVAIWTGEVALTPEQLDAMARHVGAPAETLVGDGPAELEFSGLVHPRIKRAVRRISEQHGISENDARDRIRSEFALAARSDRGAEGRLDAALLRLLREDPN